MFWSVLDNRWKVDVPSVYNQDDVVKRDVVGFIFSETDVLCPGDGATWSQYQSDGVFKLDPDLSVKMVCRTNYGNHPGLLCPILPTDCCCFYRT